MKTLMPLIFFLLSFNQKVFSRRLRNTVDDNVIIMSQFSKPHSMNDRGGSHYHTWGSMEYGSADENEYADRVIFPDSDWRDVPTTSTPKSRTRTRQCITSCQPNSQYQPVCGTDSVTYHNLEQLECFMNCGVDVRIRRLSPCVGWVTTTVSPITTSTVSNLQACLSSCPTTSEYNPVCGTDNITYNNHGKLMCAQYCGQNVHVRRRSPCPKLTRTIEPIFTDTSESITPTRTATLSSMVLACMTTCPSTPEYNPVCGSNKQTYFNLSGLQCAISCGVDVFLLKPVACHIEVKNNSPEATTKPQIPNRMIPQDLLDSIFNNNNKEDDDENYDINIRLHS